MSRQDKRGSSTSSSSTHRHAQDANPNDISSNAAARPSKLDAVSKVLLAPFNSKKFDHTRVLSDMAPVLMTPRTINAAAATISSKSRGALTSASTGAFGPNIDFATLGRAPLRLTASSRRLTSKDLSIMEDTERVLAAEVPEPEGVASDVSLLRGFNATIPSAEKGRTRRRQMMRHADGPQLGLKRLGLNARGLLTDEQEEGQSEEDVVVIGSGAGTGKRGKRRARSSLGAGVVFGREELLRQTEEIERDKENILVKRSLINNEISEITHKIEALDAIKSKLERDLLKLQEDELELDDELQGVQERMQTEQTGQAGGAHGRKVGAGQSSTMHIPPSSRRRHGPTFLPSEHDDLPSGVAFMTLDNHAGPLTALDMDEPYGTLVSASQEDHQPHVWDLRTGAEIGRLRGHTGAIKCLQVEGFVCVSGAEDGNVRLWDLRRVGEEEEEESEQPPDAPRSVAGEEEEEEDGWEVNLNDSTEEEASVSSSSRGAIRQGRNGPPVERGDPACMRVFEGHTKAVTSLYFEDSCLVTGASDKTLRQWDLNTGQCVMTMDILWAMSHPPASVAGSHAGVGDAYAAATTGTFAVPTPPYADGSWELYQDFVGGVQFMEYALVSGSGDGALRMWDMRTGQAVRTLHGHTAPVTCLQFDQVHIVSGSLDKTVKVWDVRTGGVFETLKYDHAITALQFDSRKIVAATGENGVKIYNRTSMQHSSLITNGHTRPVERLRYMDRYLVSGARDATVKIWAL